MWKKCFVYYNTFTSPPIAICTSGSVSGFEYGSGALPKKDTFSGTPVGLDWNEIPRNPICLEQIWKKTRRTNFPKNRLGTFQKIIQHRSSKNNHIKTKQERMFNTFKNLKFGWYILIVLDFAF